MATVGILTEKPSAARNFATALGGASGIFEGIDYVIVHARGHLLELKDPSAMVPAEAKDKISGWDIGALPWDSDGFKWEREVRRKLSGKGKTAKMIPDADVKSLLATIDSKLSSCTEIVCAADLDPTGEGSLLGWEIIEHLGLDTGKALSRMEFLDETPASLQKAFRDRRTVTGGIWSEGDLRKADFRSKWDMLSMQFTRLATKASGSGTVLRNGRLKSVMVVLVGDGQKAYDEWKKVPFFENRFKDENGVEYADPDADRYDSPDKAPTDLTDSPVVKDGVSRKKTAPPRLMDLAGLSALLGKKGHAPKKVLEIYQKMYENTVVSYPRTEDKFISEEQFKELLPKIDAIANCVGVDPAVLTVRTPRKSHIRSGGAHGANRPGPNVPASLSEVESSYGKIGRDIYEVLARNYLTMVAPDYEYDQHKGHVEKYPAFVGSLNVAAVQGWKGIFSTDDGDDETGEGSGAASLGTTASPFVFEGAPARPPHPNMTWLMKQLEKRSVGTGATRTSTYAEVTNDAHGKALMFDKRGKITLSDLGSLNYAMLPGTHIGSLDMTEKVFMQMSEVEAGTAATEDLLREVADLVRHDRDVMMNNAKTVDPDLLAKSGGCKQVTKIPLPEALQYSCEFGTATSFKGAYRDHEFTKAEIAELTRGTSLDDSGKIGFSVLYGNDKVEVYGGLAGGVFTPTDKPGADPIVFVSFKPEPDPKIYAVGEWVERPGEQTKFKRSWSGHSFTDAQITSLLAGKEISFTAVSAKKGTNFEATGKLGEGNFKGHKYYGFQADFGKK